MKITDGFNFGLGFMLAVFVTSTIVCGTFFLLAKLVFKMI